MSSSKVSSPNLNLVLTPLSDGDKRFIDFRTELAGDDPSSNMMLIDTAYKEICEEIGNVDNDIKDHINSADAHSEIISKLVVVSGTEPNRNCTLWLKVNNSSDEACKLVYKDKEGVLHELYTITEKSYIEGMGDVDSHISSTNNPHSVSPTQIGAAEKEHTHQDLSQGIEDLELEIKGIKDNAIYVPSSNTSDNGKILTVVDGAASWQSMEVWAGGSY